MKLYCICFTTNTTFTKLWTIAALQKCEILYFVKHLGFNTFEAGCFLMKVSCFLIFKPFWGWNVS